MTGIDIENDLESITPGGQWTGTAQHKYLARRKNLFNILAVSGQLSHLNEGMIDK